MRLQEGSAYHVIAISGGNIAILTGFLLLLGRVGGIAQTRLSLAIIGCLVSYAFVVGHEPSVTRATLAAVVVLGAGLRDLKTPPTNVLAVAAAVICIVSPLATLEPDFWLTFGATLGIVLGVARVNRSLSRVVYRGDVSPPGWVTAPLMVLAATLCAEAVLLPVGAVLFGRVSFASLVLNFVAIPLMAVTQIAGLAALVLVGFHPLPSLTAGLLAHLAATGLVESTRLLDVWPWLVVNIPPPGPFSLVSYYVALATMFWLDSPGGLRWAARVGWGVAMVAQSLEEVPFRVVKVPHHGSGGASSPAWIAATRPCVAIVSAGRSNPLGHPVPEVTARYRAAGALVLETGRHGAITLETDGRVVTLRTQTGERFRFQARVDGCGAT